MECSQVYVTPKRKFNRNTTCSPSDASPVEKRAKESKSPDLRSPGDEDQVMAALNLSEGVAEKFDLILAKLCSLDSKMEDLNTTVKSLQSKLSFVEIDIASVKDKQKNLDEKFSHMETNSIFVDERINQLESNLEKSKKEVDECHQKILHLEAYIAEGKTLNSKRNCRSFPQQCSFNSKREHWRRPCGLSWKRAWNLERQEHRIPADTQARQAKEWKWRWRSNDYCPLPEILRQRASIQAGVQT